eukprot:903992-Prymnesium_polylepis.1
MPSKALSPPLDALTPPSPEPAAMPMRGTSSPSGLTGAPPITASTARRMFALTASKLARMGT